MFDPLTIAVMTALAAPPPPIICLLPAVVVQDEGALLDVVQKIIQRFDEAQQEAFRAYRDAETDEERQKVSLPDPSDHFDSLRDIATKKPGSEAAATAAAWVLSNQQGPDPEGRTGWALEMLLDDFIDTEHIEQVPGLCSGLSTRDINALERIREHSTNERAKALADYNRAGQLMMLAKATQELHEEGSSGDPYTQYYMNGMDDDLRSKLKTEGNAEELEASGENLYEHCKKAYTEIELYAGSGMMIAASADGSLFELRNLQVGDVAPDIRGVDAEGVEFSLYDYKGQVVLLDFWGFW